ncbi:MAG: tetrahydromethanopterin S-methyltransferase subunit A [Chloroflexota bacterium]
MSVSKRDPHPGYPPVEGRYTRGNDRSPVAVAIILNAPSYKIPSELEDLVKAGIEGGAALSGMVQTENLGIEKIVCNVVANPNIRYLIVGGPESEGHLTGEALKALLDNGVDEKRKIIGTRAPFPLLLNLPLEYIDRFRRQVSLIDLQFQGDRTAIKDAVQACCSNRPTQFGDLALSDPGAYPEPALSGVIAWTVDQPWNQPESEGEAEAKKKVDSLIQSLKTHQRKEDEGS